MEEARLCLQPFPHGSGSRLTSSSLRPLPRSSPRKGGEKEKKGGGGGEATMDNAKEEFPGVYTRVPDGQPLPLYLGEVDSEDYSKDWEHVEDGSSLLEMLDRQLKKWEAGQPYMKALPNLVFLINYLTSRADSVFREIVGAEKRNVRFGQPIELPLGEQLWRSDVRMTAQR